MDSNSKIPILLFKNFIEQNANITMLLKKTLQYKCRNCK